MSGKWWRRQLLRLCQEWLGFKVPLANYFKGHGDSVMKDMKSRHGDKKGKSVFYATANKRELAGGKRSTKGKRK